MEFTLESKDLFSHLVLNNEYIATEVANTPEWKDEEKLVARLTVNGLEVPAEELDKLLNLMWEQAQHMAGVTEKADALKERAEQLLQDKANSIRETLNDLENRLQDIDQLLPYNWEK